MNLQEFCADLAYGKLSNLAMAGSGEPNGTIAVANRPTVVHAINEALLRLYSRFNIRESSLTLSLRDHITKYWLISKYAETNYPQPGVEIPYILDVPAEPFADDVIRILEVLDHDGNKLPLNDSENSRSVFTPQPNVLQHLQPVNGEILTVIYQARHPKLSHEHPHDEVYVPDVLKGALEAYTAYSVFSTMNSQDSSAKASEYIMLYESICAEVEDRDTINQTISVSLTKFQKNGWV